MPDDVDAAMRFNRAMPVLILRNLTVATAALIACLVPMPAGTAPPVLAPNVVRLAARTPHFGFNRLLVSITVCAPNTAHCANVDDVMVDTGSTGLRLEASALPRGLRLPAMAGSDGKPMATCVRYLHDAAWGRLYRADLHIGGMTASALPVHVIADTPDRPADCAISGAPSTANGTLGIGPHLTDCGGSCRQNAARPNYFTCDEGTCAPIPDRVDPAYRLSNPAALFAGHDNGIVVDLPPAPVGGATSVVGTLTFGVGTAPNNRLGAVSILRLDRFAFFTTRYAGRLYPESYIDSGTQTYVLPDDRLPRCRDLLWAFCAAPERRLEATIIGRDGAERVMAFQVGDWEDVRTRRFGVDGGIAMAAASDAKAFVWGAPFFLGKRVYVVMDGRPVPGRQPLKGPFYAFR